MKQAANMPIKVDDGARNSTEEECMVVTQLMNLTPEKTNRDDSAFIFDNAHEGTEKIDRHGTSSKVI